MYDLIIEYFTIYIIYVIIIKFFQHKHMIDTKHPAVQMTGVLALSAAIWVGLQSWNTTTAYLSPSQAGFVTTTTMASGDVPVRTQSSSAASNPITSLTIVEKEGELDGWIDMWSRPTAEAIATYKDGTKKAVPAKWTVNALYAPDPVKKPDYVVPGCDAASTCKLLFKYFHRNNITVSYEGVTGNKEILADGWYDLTLQDVPEYTDAIPDWAQDYVEAVGRTGIMTGYEDGRFGPGDAVTNAQFATMLYRAVELSDDYDTNNYGCPGSLPDGMTYGHFAYEAFCHFIRNAWDLSWGLRLNEPITRGQVAKMLNDSIGEQYYWEQEVEFVEMYNEYLGGKQYTSDDFRFMRASDVDIDGPLGRAMHFVMYENIMGENRKEFRPDDTLNRAEAATVLTRVLSFLVDNVY